MPNPIDWRFIKAELEGGGYRDDPTGLGNWLKNPSFGSNNYAENLLGMPGAQPPPVNPVTGILGTGTQPSTSGGTATGGTTGKYPPLGAILRYDKTTLPGYIIIVRADGVGGELMIDESKDILTDPSYDPTKKPTEPMTKVDEFGVTWISGNGGQTWTIKPKDATGGSTYKTRQEASMAMLQYPGGADHWEVVPTGDGTYSVREKDTSEEDYLRRQEASDRAAAAREQASIAAQAAQQQQMIAWYREQQQNELRMQKEKDLANLRANPKSWLEYAALANETPVVQPWMLPLQQEDYGWQVGKTPLPGWTGDNKQSLQGKLPSLLDPSAQLQARMGPSAYGQYQGYQQANTGASPEDTNWLLWSKAPSAGRNRTLSYNK